MRENLLKYKKIGLIAVLVIVVLSSVIIYNSSGFKQLNKNDNESIFVDDENDVSNDDLQSINKNNSSNSNNASEIKLQDKTIIVEIKGQVNNPDVYTLDENSIINDLITLAGGVTENADLSSINRAKKLQNHQMIYIADKNESGIVQDNINNSNENTMASEGLIDINSAEIEQLKTLNGIGDSKAKSIIEYREKNGGFKSIEEIKNVTGIGDKMYEKIKDSITV